MLNNEYYNTSKSIRLSYSYASGFCPASQPFLASVSLDPKQRLCAVSFECLRQSLQISKKRFVVPTKWWTMPLPSLVKIENIILLHGDTWKYVILEPQSKKLVPGVILHILFASSALDPASTWLLINQVLIIFFFITFSMSGIIMQIYSLHNILWKYACFWYFDVITLKLIEVPFSEKKDVKRTISRPATTYQATPWLIPPLPTFYRNRRHH